MAKTDSTDLQKRLFARIEPLRHGPESRIGFLFLALLAAFGAWANWAEIDEQIRTQATVIVSSRSQIVQSIDGGVITELNVREGDTVARGDLLAVLDPARVQASTDEIASKTISLRAIMQRLEAEIADTPLRFDAEIRRHPTVVRAETRLYERRQQSLTEEIASLEDTLDSFERLVAGEGASRNASPEPSCCHGRCLIDRGFARATPSIRVAGQDHQSP